MNPATEFNNSLQVLYHEEIHNFLRPILDKDLKKYSNTNFEKVLKKEVGSANAFNETIKRGLTYALMGIYHKDISTDKFLNYNNM